MLVAPGQRDASPGVDVDSNCDWNWNWILLFGDFLCWGPFSSRYLTLYFLACLAAFVRRLELSSSGYRRHAGCLKPWQVGESRKLRMQLMVEEWNLGLD